MILSAEKTLSNIVPRRDDSEIREEIKHQMTWTELGCAGVRSDLRVVSGSLLDPARLQQQQLVHAVREWAKLNNVQSQLGMGSPFHGWVFRILGWCPLKLDHGLDSYSWDRSKS